MNTQDTLARAKRLVELLEAQDRGETIESSLGGGIWEPAGRFYAPFMVGLIDCRIKPKLPTPPDGYELVSDSDSIIRNDWKVECCTRWIPASSVGDFVSLHFGNTYARPIRRLVMPDGVFWVRWPDDTQHRLVLGIDGSVIHVAGKGYSKHSIADLAKINVVWSHDRKTWFNFYGEAV